MTKRDLLERAKRRASRISPLEKIEANRLIFERSGFDDDDLERMADAVGREVEDLLLMETGARFLPRPVPVKGERGRSESTRDIADFAALRRPQRTWQQIYLEWRKTYPQDIRVTKKEDIREAHRRFYGDKSRKSY